MSQATVTVTTAADGTATAYLPSDSYFLGHLEAIIYTKTDFATGVDFAITADVSGLTLWAEDNVDASKTVHPRVQLNDASDGSALTLDGTRKNVGRIPLSNERIKISITNGGNAKTGAFRAIVL